MNPQHFQEWQASGIDNDIIRLNFESLSGTAPYDYLLYSDKLERLNAGRLSSKWLKTYRHLDNGGWYSSGLDPFNNWQPMEWGVFKPDTPRRSSDEKLIKYEHPPKTETRAFFYQLTFLQSWYITKKLHEEAYQSWFQRFWNTAQHLIEQAYPTVAQASGSPNTDESSDTRSIREFYEACQRREYGEVNRILQAVWDRSRPNSSQSDSPHSRGIERFVSLTDQGFWQSVVDDKTFPITFTEGAKKAASLISNGKAAIGLPGIRGGYRTPIDANGNRQLKSRHLIPEVDLFTGGGREIYLVFDQDTKQKTIKDVNNAIATFGELLVKQDTQVKNVTWDANLGKGVDDLIVNHGREALDKAYAEALTLEQWKGQQLSALTYPVASRVYQRYLGQLSIPEQAKLVCLKAPKGTGKTETIAGLVAEAIDNGQPVLVFTHRVQLGEALCSRFGLPYVTQLAESDTGKVFGYGLCVDSLHPQSQARFNADGWEDALIIIDEAEQVFWHMLSANTEVKKHRVAVLRQFKEVITNAITGGGRVVLSDADLSDISIDYVRGLAGVDVEPWICVNDWKPETGWDVYNYRDSTPAGMVLALQSHIAAGGKPLVLCSGQKIKSKYGTQLLEEQVTISFPERNFLRTDSETIADPSHAAFGCIAHVNEVFKNYDGIFASPSIETGVSIDIKQHFDSVWIIAQGNLSVDSVLQQSARLREGVDRHVWAGKFAGGGNLIGNGSTTPSGLLASQDRLYKAHINLLQGCDIDLENIEDGFDLVSLKTWAKMGARINAGKIKYRESILNKLQDEGHNIIDISSDPEASKGMSNQLSELRDLCHQEEASLEASVEMVTQSRYEELSKKKAKTKAERLQERKYSRHLKYGVDVTADLILKDDDGWHPQIQLHYYSTIGRDYLKARDAKRADAQISQGNFAIWKPDFNRSQLGASVRVIEALGILQLLEPGREYRKTDADLIALLERCKQFKQNIREALGITIKDTSTPIELLQRFLGKLGLNLTCDRREGSDGNRTRVYIYEPPKDGREEIYSVWLDRDTSTTSNRELIPQPVDIRFTSTTSNREEIVQQALDTNPQDEDVANCLDWVMATKTAQDAAQIWSVVVACGQSVIDGVQQLLPSWKRQQMEQWGAIA